MSEEQLQEDTDEPIVKIEDNTFEISLRVLGNELLGLRLSAYNFRNKWLIGGLMVLTVAFGLTVVFGDMIVNTFSSFM